MYLAAKLGCWFQHLHSHCCSILSGNCGMPRMDQYGYACMDITPYGISCCVKITEQYTSEIVLLPGLQCHSYWVSIVQVDKVSVGPTWIDVPTVIIIIICLFVQMQKCIIYIKKKHSKKRFKSLQKQMPSVLVMSQCLKIRMHVNLYTNVQWQGHSLPL